MVKRSMLLLIACFLVLGVFAAPAGATVGHGQRTSPAGSRLAPRGPQSPDTASGCSGNVCITVTGTGLYVDYVDGYLYASASWCGYGYLWINTVKKGSEYVCTDSSLVAHTHWNEYKNFAQDTIICVTFQGNSGEPCETVHK